MSVPDYRHVPKRLYETGLFDLHSHDGQAAFVDACVATLNGIDPNFRHLKKRPGQTHIHQHGEDSVLYLLPDNVALAVDFTAGANGPNPQPGWGVGPHVYTHADAHDPDDHGIGESSQPPAIVLPPGREEALDELNWLDGYYSAPEGLQRPNGLSLNGKPDFEGVAAWYLDVYQRERLIGNTRALARASVVSDIRHSDEWQAKHPGETP